MRQNPEIHPEIVYGSAGEPEGNLWSGGDSDDQLQQGGVLPAVVRTFLLGKAAINPRIATNIWFRSGFYGSAEGPLVLGKPLSHWKEIL